MAGAHILVVEDDPSIRRIVVLALKSAGYADVAEADSGPSALTAAAERRPDLVLLDIMLPGLDGFGVCGALRANPDTAEAAIVMLTAKGEDQDVVKGLDAGADDYVTKPFSKEVLLARIRAVLRRDGIRTDARIAWDGLVLDDARHLVSLGGEELKLTLTEYRILELLLRRPGRVFSRTAIIDLVSGGEKTVTDRTVDVQMVSLRRKLGDWARHIETIRGVGYRLADHEETP